MSTTLLRRTLSALIAGLCITLIVAFVAGSLQAGINPKEASLALRIDAARTRVFFSATDRTSFKELFDRFIVPSTGTEAMNLTTLPKGERYECALLSRTGESDAWVIYVHTPETKNHTTLLSANDQSLFLPLSRTSASLARTAIVRTYVGPKDSVWLFTEPSLMLGSKDGVLGQVVAGALHETRHLLVLSRSPDSGVVLFEGRRPTVFQTAEPDPVFATAPLFRIAIGDTETSTLGSLEALPTSIREGMEGVLKNALESRTGRTNIAAFRASMMNGGASLTVMRKGSAFALGITGKARSIRDLKEWSDALTTSAAGKAAVRDIVFPKKENTRHDVTAEQKPEAESLGMMNGWETVVTGSGSSSPLFSATQGREYVLATDQDLLTELIGNRAGATDDDAGAALRGTMDAAWVQNILHSMPESIPGASKKEFRSLVGSSAARIVWSMRPVDGGWMLRWHASRNVSTPSAPPLVN